MSYSPTLIPDRQPITNFTDLATQQSWQACGNFWQQSVASALRCGDHCANLAQQHRSVHSLITAMRKNDGLSAGAMVRSHHADGIAFECDAGEIAGCVGAGVDVDTLSEDLGLHDRRMSVHDNLLKIVSLVFEKLVSYP
jgi:hypothetical protein